MKIFSLVLIVLTLSACHLAGRKLKGRYQFVPTYGKPYKIHFDNSTYIKYLRSGDTSRGIIEYGDNYIYLRDYDKELKIIDSHSTWVSSNKLKEQDLISLEIIKKKSIRYYHHVYQEGGPNNWLDVAVESGKLIRLK